MNTFWPAALLKETPTQLFSCEIVEISKIIFSHRTPLMAATDHSKFKVLTFEMTS